MNLIDELRGLGVDVEEGVERVMGDHSLYEMMLGMFIESVNSSQVRVEDFEKESLEGLIDRIHMLKGVTGNLAMTPLFARYTEVLGKLRSGQPEEAKAGFEGLLPIQEEIINCITRYQ